MHRRLADPEEQEHAMNRAALLLALILLPCCARADGLGRLFFSPAERAHLDYLHAQNVASDGGSSNTSGGVIVNGIVQKDGGKRTVWINGVPQDAGHSDERNPTSVSVSVPGQSKPVRIKVGQRLVAPDEPPPPEAAGK